jgi:hypothetical protein
MGSAPGRDWIRTRSATKSIGARGGAGCLGKPAASWPFLESISVSEAHAEQERPQVAGARGYACRHRHGCGDILTPVRTRRVVCACFVRGNWSRPDSDDDL